MINVSIAFAGIMSVWFLKGSSQLCPASQREKVTVHSLLETEWGPKCPKIGSQTLNETERLEFKEVRTRSESIAVFFEYFNKITWPH